MHNKQIIYFALLCAINAQVNAQTLTTMPNSNISINETTINKTNTTYTSGTGIEITSGNKINVLYDNDTIQQNTTTGKLYTNVTADNVQHFIPGDNITIDNDYTINAPEYDGGIAITKAAGPGWIRLELNRRANSGLQADDRVDSSVTYIYAGVDNKHICYDANGNLTTRGCINGTVDYDVNGTQNGPYFLSTKFNYGVVTTQYGCSASVGSANSDWSTTTILTPGAINKTAGKYCYCRIYDFAGTYMPGAPYVFYQEYESATECFGQCACPDFIKSNKNYRAAIYAASGIANSGN